MSSAKKAKKYGDIRVPAQSLMPPDKDGYLTKQGGSIKTWKRRYFILKGKQLFYYKTPKDQVFTGKIDLEASSLVKEEDSKKKVPARYLSIQTANRVYYMYPDRPEEMKDWIDAIARGIAAAKGGNSSPGTVYSSFPENSQNSENAQRASSIQSSNNFNNNPSNTTSNNTSSTNPTTSTNAPNSSTTTSTNPTTNSSVSRQSPMVATSDMSPRVRLSLAKGVVNFLRDEESKVLEFWQIWSESIPPREELTAGLAIEFFVSTSADMQKLTWRTNGPQNIFIQKMVDFFWNVGAPESEIDRLNDVGALINPVKIGSWIDMSSKGGMDGGWHFPVDIPLKLAAEAADPGDAVKSFTEWAEGHGIISVFAVGRDMGAAPPRQTELRLKLPGNSFEDQLRVGIDSFQAFRFPPIPDNALAVLKNSKVDVSNDNGLCLSVITSSEGFVRLGLLVPRPSTENVLALCSIAGGNNDELAAFEGSLGATGTDGPIYAEYQYLMKGFGYGVYKEGFDIVFHYKVGVEELAE